MYLMAIRRDSILDILFPAGFIMGSLALSWAKDLLESLILALSLSQAAFLYCSLFSASWNLNQNNSVQNISSRPLPVGPCLALLPAPPGGRPLNENVVVVLVSGLGRRGRVEHVGGVGDLYRAGVPPRVRVWVVAGVQGAGVQVGVGLPGDVGRLAAGVQVDVLWLGGVGRHGLLTVVDDPVVHHRGHVHRLDLEYLDLAVHQDLDHLVGGGLDGLPPGLVQLREDPESALAQVNRTGGLAGVAVLVINLRLDYRAAHLD